MKRIMSLVLVVVMLVGLNVNVFAEAKTIKWETVIWGTKVDTFNGEMDLSQLDIDPNDILGFDILKGNKRANLFYGVDGSKIKFASEMDLNTNYSLRIITNSKYYNIKFKSSDLTDIKETGDSIVVKIPAMPEKGFNWPYYLRIPSNQFKSSNLASKRYLMIDMPNGGARDLDGIEKWVKRTLENGAQRSVGVAEELWTPIIIPAYPVANSFYEVDGIPYMTYEHALDRETARLHLNYKNPKTKNLLVGAYSERDLDVKKFLNLDKQIIAMFDHAVEYLNKYGHNMETDKMFLNGYSATGTFTDRFTAFHPEKVKAIASGGTLDDMVLPLSSYKGKDLIFPIGTSDYKEITGKDFNLNKHNQVARLIFMGKDDDNNTVEHGYLDCYSDFERDLIIKLFGYDILPRAKALIDVYGKSGGKGMFILDKETGHGMSRDMGDYITEFFKANRDTKIPTYPKIKDPKQLEYKLFK